MKTTSILLALTTSAAFPQGPLTPPPGAPAPSMKSLDQIEARTPIPKTVTPAAGPHFTITQPGSYYLTGDVIVTTGDAIRVTGTDVKTLTLDLNGYSITSTLTGSSTGSAITIPAATRSFTVSNGHIVSGTTVGGTPTKAGFAYGIHNDTSTTTGSHVSGLHVSGIGEVAIFLKQNGIVENCTVASSNKGIVASAVDRCIVTGAYIGAIEAEIVTSSTGYTRESSGITAFTISESFGVSINGSGISSSGNVHNSRGSSSTAYGITTCNATQCYARTVSGFNALKASGTATSCNVSRFNGGVALEARIAIGCTTESGTITATSGKFLGTP